MSKQEYRQYGRAGGKTIQQLVDKAEHQEEELKAAMKEGDPGLISKTKKQLLNTVVTLDKALNKTT